MRTQSAMQLTPENQEVEPKGISIELMIYADGRLSVSVEADDNEAGETNEQPAKSLAEALQIIEQEATAIMQPSRDSQEADLQAGYKGAQ